MSVCKRWQNYFFFNLKSTQPYGWHGVARPSQFYFFKIYLNMITIKKIVAFLKYIKIIVHLIYFFHWLLLIQLYNFFLKEYYIYIKKILTFFLFLHVLYISVWQLICFTNSYISYTRPSFNSKFWLRYAFRQTREWRATWLNVSRGKESCFTLKELNFIHLIN